MPSIEENRIQWGQQWEWACDGDEWTNFAAHCQQPYEQWKQSLIDSYLKPSLFCAVNTIVEIGCGHGRWSAEILKVVKNPILVDLATECLEYCKQRFGEGPTYLQASGLMPAISDNSVEFVWSFDTFVHIDPDDIAIYLSEFARILVPNAYAIIHHADDWMSGPDGWRSQVTASWMREAAETYGLVVTHQTDSWGNKHQYNVRRHHDIISFIWKP